MSTGPIAEHAVTGALGRFVVGFTAKGDATLNPHAAQSAIFDRDLSGRCTGGRHEQCAHAVGGPQEAGTSVPVSDYPGLPVISSIWRCGCSCHVGPDPQRYKPWRDKWLAAAHRARSGAAWAQPALFDLAAS